MDCADIVIGAAVAGLSRVKDYYTADRSTPKQDQFYGGSQSLTAAIASQSDSGITTVIFRRPLLATEMTDHTIENEMMTAIWSHGQKEGDTPGLGYFYGPDEVKYHAGNRGRLTMNFHEVEDSSERGSWSTPRDCVGSACTYRAEWSFDADSDMIQFTIIAKQSIDQWTGIAFAPEPQMQNMDVHLGYVRNSMGVIYDGWTGDRFTTPAKDAVQNMENASVTYDDGMLTLTFQRARNTSDDKDWAFTDSESGCYYFIFPVGGGPHTGTGISRHSRTPIISSSKICIAEATTASATTLKISGRLMAWYFLASLVAMATAAATRL